MSETEASKIVERAQGRLGELALRAVGNHYEIILNGAFLMDTRNGESERLLARLTLGDRSGRLRLLIGGLGVGFSLAEALRSDQVEQVTVVEIEPRIIAWGRTSLASFSSGALSDPRVEVINDDLVGWLDRSPELFDGICLDVDNGPNWTVAEANGALYTDAGLALMRARLRPGGVLTVWSAAEAPAFAERLRLVFGGVEAFRLPVPRGDPDVIYVARRGTLSVWGPTAGA
jgi:spermidine synthase